MVKPLSRHDFTIRAALGLGFGLTLGVWLFTGYYFTRRMSSVEAEAAAVSARYMRAQELLSNVSAQVLLSSVYLRDALLEPNAVQMAIHRQRLDESYDALERELDTYVPVLDSTDEREQLTRLRQEIDAFRTTTRDVLGLGVARSALEARKLLNTRVVPRRESVIRMSEDVRALNRAAFIDQQRVIADLHRAANRQSWQWLSVALAVSLAIGLLATMYSARLEHRLRRQRATDFANSERLQVLSTRLMRAQELERQNLARELHDEVGQVLTALKVELAVAQRRIAASDGAPELLDDVLSIADAALQSVRDLSYLLHPALLDDLGLAAAVDWYLRAFEKRHAIKVHLQQEGVDRLAPATELAAYRIIQEAMTNVARHARARACKVTVRRAGDLIRIVIEDNGRGFDATQSNVAVRRGLGLLNMRERAERLQGSLTITSAPGSGTRVQADLPAVLVRTDDEPIAGEVLHA